MRELAIALGIAGAITALVLIVSLPFGQAVGTGLWLVGVGLSVGIPAGVVYHVLLHKELRRAGHVPRDWIWRPTELNSTLSDYGRRRVMPACWIGAAGCGLAFFGLAVLFMSMMLD